MLLPLSDTGEREIDRRLVLARLRSADRSVLAVVMAYLPVFRPLWDDPGFNDLLEDAGLRRLTDGSR